MRAGRRAVSGRHSRGLTVAMTALVLVTGAVAGVSWPSRSSAAPAPTRTSLPAPLSSPQSPIGTTAPGVQGRRPQPHSAAAGHTGFDEQTSTITSRTAQTNVFANADGTKTLQTSQSSINYFDTAGWKPIDNSVIPDPDRAGGLINGANSWRVHFGTSDQGLAIVTGAGSMSVVPVGVRAGIRPTVTEHGVTYIDAWPDADLTYVVTGDSVKETVFLKSAAAGSRFSFRTFTGSKASVLSGSAAALGVTARDNGFAPAG